MVGGRVVVKVDRPTGVVTSDVYRWTGDLGRWKDEMGCTAIAVDVAVFGTRWGGRSSWRGGQACRCRAGSHGPVLPAVSPGAWLFNSEGWQPVTVGA